MQSGTATSLILCPVGWFCMTLSHTCSSKRAHFQTAGSRLAKIWAFSGAPGFFTAPRCISRCHLWNKISPWEEKALQQPFPLSSASCTLMLSSSRDHTACCLVNRVQPHLGKDAAISTPLNGYLNLYWFQIFPGPSTCFIYQGITSTWL